MAISRLAGVAVHTDAPIAPLTTLRIGPIARRLIVCEDTATLAAVLRELPAGEPPERQLLLAGGSNLVIADDLADLTVIRVASTGIDVTGSQLRAAAGTPWDDVVCAAVDHGLGGLECLAGIPGTAGATPVQNVGAYGVEVSQLISRVRLLDRRNGTDHWVDGPALAFGYRTSALRGSVDAAVLEVEFALHGDGLSAPVRYAELAAALDVGPGERTDPARVRAAVLALRAGKGMVLDGVPQAPGSGGGGPDHDTWSVGSFFTNPVVDPAVYQRLAGAAGAVPHWPAGERVKLAAGWLVERAGFGRGYPGPAAPARLSTKHALALTNRGGARSADLLALARTVRDGVRAAFGIELTPEPQLVGCGI